MALLKEFYKCSGLKINVDKTQVAWLGSNRQKNAICSDLNLSWVTRFCLLGIDFDTSLKIS